MKQETTYILVINPGSTSTKVALYNGETNLHTETIPHSSETLAGFSRITDQLDMRKDAIMDFLAACDIEMRQLSGVVGRGGLLKPLTGGTYLVNDAICSELIHSKREHASNLRVIIAKEIADAAGVNAYTVDPVVVDELEPLARFSGLKGIEKISSFHALNQKARARQAAAALNRAYETCNLIVAHMGGGITVGAHKNGKVVDVNNGLDGEGPFSPERSGTLPLGAIIDICFNSGLTQKEVTKKFIGQGGLVSYLGTSDVRRVETMISEEHDEAALLAFNAMAYQIAKEIGRAATVLQGKVDAIVLTGGLANAQRLTKFLEAQVGFIAPVMVFPGEGKIEALAAGCLRVLRGEEAYREYK